METQRDYHVPADVSDPELLARRARGRRLLGIGLVSLVVSLALNELKPVWLAPPNRDDTWLVYLFLILIALYLLGRGLGELARPRLKLLVLILWLVLAPMCMCIGGFSQKARYELLPGFSFFTYDICTSSGQRVSCTLCDHNPDFDKETVIFYEYRRLGPTGLMWQTDLSRAEYPRGSNLCN